MKSERVPELSILKKLVMRECGPEWIMGKHLDGYLYAYGYVVVCQFDSRKGVE